jgi:hypothetical protein
VSAKPSARSRIDPDEVVISNVNGYHLAGFEQTPFEGAAVEDLESDVGFGPDFRRVTVKTWVGAVGCEPHGDVVGA